MARRVTWSPAARSQFRGIIEYVCGAWSRQVAERVRRDYLGRIALLAQFPNLGHASPARPGVRLLSLSPLHAAAYEQPTQGGIRILALVDLRAAPSAMGE